ncbi:(2Fe-2S)-binding protein [Stieleria varia]|uniref:BFD-like [2Fe-2S] binding domain protein n=1 Tax=Stieleria varia TaxID=2528005 RepID=A0A5C6AR51_9BACT|nr:(2Fe-2S)-binding protein [Stieleria varia]TWU02435.1 BFD-like [2Fe-2S] binding domain protein [Stieleria varia]
MKDDDELCLCFHVSRRKVIQFLKTQRPKSASQLSECFGAGTGCGWCRPFLRRLWESEQPETESLPNPETYATERAAYRDKTP